MAESEDIKPGDKVTLGLGTHDMEVQVWITFPDLGTTHEEDPNSTESCTHYRQIKTPVRHYETMKILCVKKPGHLTGTIVEFRTNAWGSEMALVDLDNKKRWFSTFLLNCPPLSVIGKG